jgi:hypothetical protein
VVLYELHRNPFLVTVRMQNLQRVEVDHLESLLRVDDAAAANAATRMLAASIREAGFKPKRR